MTLQFAVKEELCTRCGDCVSDCIMRVIEQIDGGIPSINEAEAADCFGCQHCLAVCPTGALSVHGRAPEDSLPLVEGALPNFRQMTTLVRGRRSVRQYRDENVDPALIRELLAALANAPTGVNRRELTHTLIDDKDVMQRFRTRMMAAIIDAADGNRLPAGSSYLLRMVNAYRNLGRDTLFRGAPHALLISAPPDAPCPQQDVALSLAYFELMAQCAGLGTVWWGMLKAMLEAVPEMKADLGLPAGHEYYAMLFGVPAIRYARTVQRDDAAVVRRVKM